MALKRLKVKMTKVPAKAGDMPIVEVEGDLISRYVKADAALKAADALMKELRPEILEIGTGEVFKASCAHPTNPALTVKLTDDTDDMVRVQFTKRYGAIADANMGEVENLFAAAKLDINAFVHETVVGTFDDKVFLDAEGNFSQKVYDRFRKAIEAVAAELQVPCPLTTHKVVVPKDVFHTDRFHKFPETVQVQLSALMPNTTQIVPVPKVKDVPVTVNKPNGK